MSWWVPFAFVGAALVGLAIALSLTAGRPRGEAAAPELLPHEAGRRKSRYEQDNEIPWNAAAFAWLVVVVGVVVLIAILVEVL